MLQSSRRACRCRPLAGVSAPLVCLQVIFPLQAAEGVRRVALVPSTRDAHHLPVFPQPPLCAEGGGEKMVLLDNPSTFCCRGVTFGVVTADVLRHLSSQEIQYGNPGSDRLAAIASHLIWQQRWG